MRIDNTRFRGHVQLMTQRPKTGGAFNVPHVVATLDPTQVSGFEPVPPHKDFPVGEVSDYSRLIFSRIAERDPGPVA